MVLNYNQYRFEHKQTDPNHSLSTNYKQYKGIPDRVEDKNEFFTRKCKFQLFDLGLIKQSLF